MKTVLSNYDKDYIKDNIEISDVFRLLEEWGAEPYYSGNSTIISKTICHHTLNEDALREKSFRCIDGLRSGVADGIQVSKNLTVYTTLPGENPSIDDYENILDTLSKNNESNSFL